eukprot:1995611-Prymnesium_polylepis.1
MSVISASSLGMGCPSAWQSREQSTRRASARHDRLTPLSSTSVPTSSMRTASSLASSATIKCDGCGCSAGGVGVSPSG